jgi:hypothetical protein
MHCSIWRFSGDPDELERRYLALLGEVPAANHVLHAAARTPAGLVVFDTCPSEEAFHAFFGSPEVRALFERHGLPLPDCEHYPVVAAYAARERVDASSWRG